MALPSDLSHVTLNRTLCHVYQSSAWTPWDGGTTIDMTADIEITGTNCTNRGYTPSASGSNTIITVDAGYRVRVYKALLSVSADVTGEVYLKVGSNKVGTVQNPKEGGQYILISTFPDYEIGDDGDDVSLTLPSGTSVSLNVSYELVAA